MPGLRTPFQFATDNLAGACVDTFVGDSIVTLNNGANYEALTTGFMRTAPFSVVWCGFEANYSSGDTDNPDFVYVTEGQGGAFVGGAGVSMVGPATLPGTNVALTTGTRLYGKVADATELNNGANFFAWAMKAMELLFVGRGAGNEDWLAGGSPALRIPFIVGSYGTSGVEDGTISAVKLMSLVAPAPPATPAGITGYTATIIDPNQPIAGGDNSIRAIDLTFGVAPGHSMIGVQLRGSQEATPSDANKVVNAMGVWVYDAARAAADEGLWIGSLSVGGWDDTDHIIHTTEAALGHYLGALPRKNAPWYPLIFLVQNATIDAAWETNIKTIGDRCVSAGTGAGYDTTPVLFLPPPVQPEGIARFQSARTRMASIAAEKGWIFIDLFALVSDQSLVDINPAYAGTGVANVHPSLLGADFVMQLFWDLLQTIANTIQEQAMPAIFVDSGKAIEHTPVAAVTAGDVIVQGELVGVAKLDIPAGSLGALAVEGVFDFPKTAGVGEAITAGADVFWDAGAGVATEAAAAGANKAIGRTIAAVGDNDTTVRVRMSQ